jgi:hypothetical protein
VGSKQDTTGKPEKRNSSENSKQQQKNKNQKIETAATKTQGKLRPHETPIHDTSNTIHTSTKNQIQP